MHIRLTRGVIIGMVLVLICYFGLIPLFWPPPAVELSIPPSAHYDQDASITLTISSVHANVQVTSVYLVVNYNNYQDLGLPAGVHPIALYHADDVRQFWTWPSRFTWPRSRRYEYTIPLRALASQGLSMPGILQGRAHVKLQYPDLHRFNRVPGYGYRMRTSKQAVPFTVLLTGNMP